MGEEVETTNLREGVIRPSETLRKNRVARWLIPNYMDELAAMEDQLFEKAQSSVSQMNLQLNRVRDQNRQLLNEDVGRYRSITTRWSQLATGDYNPDTISYDEYKKMNTYDAQVIAGVDLIQMGVLMKPWRIRHNDQAIIDDLTKALNTLRYPSFRDAMKQMLDAIFLGFSVTEIVFEQYGNYWMPRHSNGLKTFDPDYIRFHSDEYGNLRGVEQRLGGYQNWLPQDRIVIWSHEKKYGNRYGNALLKGCYKNWYIKDAMLKFANIAYERFGSPILMGIVKNTADMTTMSQNIEHLYARSQAVIVRRDDKDPTNVEVLESRRKEMPFDRYIRYHDEMILRRMLIGQRLFEGGGGTYGPKVPLDIIFMRFEDFRMELVDALNDMLRIIVDLNWEVDGDYPRLEFAPLTTLDQQQLRQSIYEAIDRGIVERGEPWVRDELGFREWQKPVKQLPLPEQRVPGDGGGPSEQVAAERIDMMLEAAFHEMKRKRQDDDEEEEW